MNENLNLIEILKDCPKGIKLYSSVFGEVKFDCVDGPDFDAHKIDFDEVINRTRVYKDQERKRDERCNLLKQG